jgi:SSS family solute:Na+ symporter
LAWFSKLEHDGFQKLDAGDDEADAVGGRGSGTALNVATYIGTGLGLVTLMYASIDAFSHGFAYVTLALIGAGVGIFLGATGFVISPLRELKLITIPEFFERRFDKRTRVTGGIICALAGILNMGLFPKMGATFLTYATGLGNETGNAALTVNIVTSALIVLP